jgi:hypothetical protein
MEVLAGLRQELSERIEVHQATNAALNSPVLKFAIHELRHFAGRLDTAMAAEASRIPVIKVKPGHGDLPDCLPERTHAWHQHVKGDEEKEGWKTCKWCGHVRAMEHGDKVSAGRERAATLRAREAVLASAGILVDLTPPEE